MTDATDARYRLFARAYVANGMNGKAAAITAGYSEKSAETQASRLLRIAKVSGYIEELLQPVLDRYEITVERTLAHLASIAYSDLSDVGQWDATGFRLRPEHELPIEARRSIKKVKVKVEAVPGADGEPVRAFKLEYELEMHSKLDALDRLMKYQGLLPTTGKVRSHPDSRQQTVNPLVLAGLTREEIIEIARGPRPEDPSAE